MLKNTVLGLVVANIIVGTSILTIGCNQADTVNNQNNTKQEEVIGNHKFGEVVDMDEEGTVTVSVIGIRKLQEDNIYAVEVQINNNSNEEVVAAAGTNFILKDNDNVKGDMYITPEEPIRGMIVADTIRPNDTLKGEMLFKLHEGYTPSTMEIDLGLGYYTVFDLK